jgi:methyl-accepting chemotaxis protein
MNDQFVAHKDSEKVLNESVNVRTVFPALGEAMESQAKGSEFVMIDGVTELTGSVYDSILKVVSETKQMKDIVHTVNEIAITNDGSAQNVSAATEQQSAVMEQVSHATEELARMSLELQQEIAKFKL